ncbi:TetR/AcrR family transcriptional regulator [Pyruvatibacter sp.]|uniref:TetR/AcrR family transcriptional regulator n=1 Tax=Pyruvatibacter sp. TaxID=1981328 RepID=UPI0032EBBBF1
MKEKDDIRDAILEAARERFLHYGYGKTTMAEIARDCDMSPGNLYRFFEGKLDLAEEIARKASLETMNELARAIRSPGKTATQAMRDYLFGKLRMTYTNLEKDPKIIELAQTVSAERPQFSNDMLERERQIMMEIIANGRELGEFATNDVQFTAEMIQSATMKFSYPQLWSRLTLDNLERELAGVFDLVLGGLCPDRTLFVGGKSGGADPARQSV